MKKKNSKREVYNYTSEIEETEREDLLDLRKIYKRLFEINKIEMPKYFFTLSNDLKYVDKIENVFIQAELYIHKKASITELKKQYPKAKAKPRNEGEKDRKKWIKIISAWMHNC